MYAQGISPGRLKVSPLMSYVEPSGCSLHRCPAGALFTQLSCSADSTPGSLPAGLPPPSVCLSWVSLHLLPKPWNLGTIWTVVNDLSDHHWLLRRVSNPVPGLGYSNTIEKHKLGSIPFHWLGQKAERAGRHLWKLLVNYILVTEATLNSRERKREGKGDREILVVKPDRA